MLRFQIQLKSEKEQLFNLNCFIGHNVQIGKNCLIHANVTIYDNTVIGDNVMIHAGTILGADAFITKKTSRRF